jgi:hypothetical protein
MDIVIDLVVVSPGDVANNTVHLPPEQLCNGIGVGFGGAIVLSRFRMDSVIDASSHPT